MRRDTRIKRMYDLLDRYFGDLGWWPADSPFEVIVGTILTQNASWKNVEKAIASMKEKGLVDIARVREVSAAVLSRAIRPSGYHRVKSGRLKCLADFLYRESGGKLDSLRKMNKNVLREKLLGVKGVGPETADSILLYAFDKPVFVVDAYTRRVFSRHGLCREKDPYEKMRSMVEAVPDKSVKRLKQFHALIVEAGKNFCKKKKGLCGTCPLGGLGDVRRV